MVLNLIELEFSLRTALNKLKTRNQEFFCGDKYIKFMPGLKVVQSNILYKGQFLMHIPLDFTLFIVLVHLDGVTVTRLVGIKDQEGEVVLRMVNPQEVTYTP